MTEDDYPGPFTIDTRPKQAGEFAPGVMARLIQRPGEHHTESGNRINAYTKKGFLIPAARDLHDGRGAFLFTRESALAAAIFSEIASAGMHSPGFNSPDASASAMVAAHVRLYGWREGEKRRTPNPLGFIWKTYDADPTRPPGWSLRVQWMRHISNGQFVCHASLGYRAEEDWNNRPLGEGFWPTADMIMPIDPHLAMIDGKMRAAGL